MELFALRIRFLGLGFHSREAPEAHLSRRWSHMYLLFPLTSILLPQHTTVIRLWDSPLVLTASIAGQEQHQVPPNAKEFVAPPLSFPGQGHWG